MSLIKSILVMISLLLLLSGCKNNSIQSIIKKAEISVNNLSSENSSCISWQIYKWDSSLRSKSKLEKQQIYTLFNDKIDAIQLAGDEKTKTSTGARSILYYVQCDSSYCSEVANKELLGKISTVGKEPTVNLKIENRTLYLGVEYHSNEVITRKYYTRNVNTYDRVSSLEDALNEVGVWNPTNSANYNSRECATIDLSVVLGALSRN